MSQEDPAYTFVFRPFGPEEREALEHFLPAADITRLEEDPKKGQREVAERAQRYIDALNNVPKFPMVFALLTLVLYLFQTYVEGRFLGFDATANVVLVFASVGFWFAWYVVLNIKRHDKAIGGMHVYHRIIEERHNEWLRGRLDAILDSNKGTLASIERSMDTLARTVYAMQGEDDLTLKAKSEMKRVWKTLEEMEFKPEPKIEIASAEQVMEQAEQQAEKGNMEA